MIFFIFGIVPQPQSDRDFCRGHTCGAAVRRSETTKSLGVFWVDGQGFWALGFGTLLFSKNPCVRLNDFLFFEIFRSHT